MKQIAAIFIFTCISAAAVAQAGDPQIPETNLTSAVVGSAAKLTTSNVVINPRQAKGQPVTISLINLEKGKYTVYLHNKDGKRFQLRSLTLEAGSSTQIVDLPKDVASGTYILQVLSKTARFSKKMLVE